MTATGNKKIQVYADWETFDKPFLLGELTVSKVRGDEIFSFSYTEEWLQSEYLQMLDPDLLLFPGQQYLSNEKPNFGMFLDSSPDRWGRTLMKRREAAIARKEGRKENVLLESDFLLGVYDEQRIGALRFKTSKDGAFLNHDSDYAVPPMTSLRELEYACNQIERDDISNDIDYFNYLRLLLAPGSSLGGARPKAGVIDLNKHLWIAKFPSRNDDIDIGAWEMVVHELAQKSKISVPDARIEQVLGKHHTYLSKRFDRNESNKRIHFATAMTLLGKNDGANFNDGSSYLDIAGFIIQHGATVQNDLEELWKRIVFSICVSNTDDHLRNHGFLLTRKGWILSPAYDMNPVNTGRGLTLNISDTDNALSLDLAKDVIPYFNLTKDQASKIISNIVSVVSEWKTIAKKHKISNTEIERMTSAFEVKK